VVSENRSQQLEGHEFEPPDPSTGDTAHLVARGILSIVPGLSELFEEFVTPPLEKRLDEWRDNVGNTLKYLEEKKGISLELLQQDEEFVDIVLQATQIAMRNSQIEKRIALRNAIVNTAIMESIDHAHRQMFLNYIDIFTVWHIEMLKLMQNPLEWGKRNDHEYPLGSSGSLARIITSAYPELDGQRDFYDQVWAELRQRGLVNTDSLHTMMTTRGTLDKRTTDFGDLFLEYVEEPN
jgi:hypothetical protein